MKIKILEKFKNSIKALTTNNTKNDQLASLINFLGLQDTEKSE